MYLHKMRCKISKIFLITQVIAIKFYKFFEICKKKRNYLFFRIIQMMTGAPKRAETVEMGSG